MDERIYIHTINNKYSDYYKPERQKTYLEDDLKHGELRSRRLRGDLRDNTNFSGLDYISLSDYELRFSSNEGRRHYNSFYGYASSGISLAFPKDKIEVIKPTIISICSDNRRGFEAMRTLGMCEDERFSDLPDEVQVKNRLSLEHMNGILFPTENFLVSKVFTKRIKMIELLKKEIEEIRELLIKYGYDVNLYDVDTLNELNEEEIYKLSLK